MAYLGTGGWLIEVGYHALMTAPHFTNPGWGSVLFGSVSPDHGRIDRALDTLRTAHTEAILVGHAHYDHLLDVPRTLERHTPSAAVYGSATVRNLIARSVPDSTAIVTIRPEEVATIDTEGRWFESPSGRFRWMAIESSHSDHFWKIQLFKGEVDEPRDELPDDAGEWKVGETYAFLVEVLDDRGDAALRIYYNDSGSTRPLGYPPETLLEDDVPLVAILTAPGYRWERDYPEEMIAHLSPDFLIAGHWEDFFREQDGDPRPIPGTFFRGFIERVDATGVRWVAPDPDDRLVFVRR
jgi:hypothetical protein